MMFILPARIRLIATLALVFATLCIILFNLFVDLLYAWIDPRIRLT